MKFAKCHCGEIVEMEHDPMMQCVTVLYAIKELEPLFLL